MADECLPSEIGFLEGSGGCEEEALFVALLLVELLRTIGGTEKNRRNGQKITQVGRIVGIGTLTIAFTATTVNKAAAIVTKKTG